MVYTPNNPWTFPVNPNFPWLPDARIITSITNSNPALITTLVPHGYSSGFNVRIFFPSPFGKAFGMTQIAGQTGVITVLSPTTFSITIDSRDYDPFFIGTTLETAQVLPIGQYTNQDLDDFVQVNPINPSRLSDVKIFQSRGAQAHGPCSTSQT